MYINNLYFVFLYLRATRRRTSLGPSENSSCVCLDACKNFFRKLWGGGGEGGGTNIVNNFCKYCNIMYYYFWRYEMLLQSTDSLYNPTISFQDGNQRSSVKNYLFNFIFYVYVSIFSIFIFFTFNSITSITSFLAVRELSLLS